MPEIRGYRLSHVIGEGGMSTVYLGTQLSLAREVAIKVMRPEALADEVSRRRFENEARTIARLEHPHIVGIYEVGRTVDGLPWYAMPHLPRGHVGQRDLTRDPQTVRQILRSLLSALAFAHARGVIHRDVKAENVLFDEADRPLLADFGIALRRGHGTRVTMTGLAVGSTAYMAPEQARGQQVDHRVDLYSLGVLAWEMLAGGLPYQADDALAMAIQHAQNPLPRLPHELRHWQRFMDRAMAKSPRKRFHDAQQMLQALDGIPLGAEGQRLPLARIVRRGGGALRRLPAPAWVPVVLVGAAALGWLLHDLRPAPRPAVAEAAATGTDAAARIAGSAGASSPADPAGEDAPDALATNDAAAMHGAAPLSEADRLLERVDAQLADGRLAVPASDNAATSLVAAWRSDAAHPQLAAATARVLAALAEATATALSRQRDEDATALLRAAARVHDGPGASASAATTAWRERVATALRARADQAAEALDRKAALQVVEQARLARLPAAALERLRAQAARLPDLGGGDAAALQGMLLVDMGGRHIAAFDAPVSRSAYARFAEAGDRKPALCRERISLLRVLDPREWKTPGFEQSDADPVVCVSWEDAQAYARWLGARDGHRYRLATADEAARLPAPGAARAVSEWRADCASDCSRRSATGPSWRTRNAARGLDPARGYDDVGFRLVRDL